MRHIGHVARAFHVLALVLSRVILCCVVLWLSCLVLFCGCLVLSCLVLSCRREWKSTHQLVSIPFLRYEMCIYFYLACWFSILISFLTFTKAVLSPFYGTCLGTFVEPLLFRSFIQIFFHEWCLVLHRQIQVCSDLFSRLPCLTFVIFQWC